MHRARVDDRPVTAPRRRASRGRGPALLAQKLTLWAIVAADLPMLGLGETTGAPAEHLRGPKPHDHLGNRLGVPCLSVCGLAVACALLRGTQPAVRKLVGSELGRQ